MKIKILFFFTCLISFASCKITRQVEEESSEGQLSNDATETLKSDDGAAVVKTEGGNGNGAPCKFPFTYRKKEYTACTDIGVKKGYTWCSTTSNYDTDKKWGYCPSETEMQTTDGPVTSNGARCKFPFTYNGKSYDRCTDAGDQYVRLWCATTSNYSRDKKKGFCPKDPNRVIKGFILKEVEISEEDKQLFLTHVNKLRAEVGPEPATNMRQLTWDDELAAAAKTWSRKCIFGHSKPKDRRTAAFHWTGENAYFRYPPWETGTVLVRSLDSFMREKKRFKYGKYGEKGTGSRYGHYTQQMWANSYKVGCGVTNCGNFNSGGGEYWAKGQVVICVYGPGGNVKGQYPWDNSGPSCSKCPTGKTCLCRPKE